MIYCVNFMGYTVFSNQLSQIPKEKKLLINTLNQYSFCIAEKDPEFKKALQASDILLPDGMAIVKAVKLLTGQKIKKIAGADIHQFLLNNMNKRGGKCFYLGASDSTLQKIKERLFKEFPNIQMESFSPPFKGVFSEIENIQMVDAVNAFQPDVLFIGLTAPKQEKWSLTHKEQLDAKIICSVGAVFDFYAGTVDRPSPFWIKLGLEWFIRLIKEPKRMWKRYLYYGPIFIYFIVKEKLKQIRK